MHHAHRRRTGSIYLSPIYIGGFSSERPQWLWKAREERENASSGGPGRCGIGRTASPADRRPGYGDSPGAGKLRRPGAGLGQGTPEAAVSQSRKAERSGEREAEAPLSPETGSDPGVGHPGGRRGRFRTERSPGTGAVIQRKEQGDLRLWPRRRRPSPRSRRERRRWQQRRLGDHTLTVELPVANQACETAGTRRTGRRGEGPARAGPFSLA